MFYGPRSIKGADGNMWSVVSHTPGYIRVETIVAGKRIQGEVYYQDARAYREGKLAVVWVINQKEVV